MLLSYIGIYAAIQMIFYTGPLFLSCLLGPSILGVPGESWMFPDTYGSWEAIFDNGLAGWWGRWWHQTFRFAFSAPSQWLIRRFNLNPKATSSVVLSLVTAFMLSGFLHACGSIAQLPTTKPWSGPFLFFMLQPLGIMGQMIIVRILRKLGITDQLPVWVRKGGNFVLTHAWLFYTGPLLVDDFARGGAWLFEPIPVSPLRGLGFGLHGEGWWCVPGPIVTWHTGRHWWQSGLAL
jgi:hypothetical protein